MEHDPEHMHEVQHSDPHANEDPHAEPRTGSDSESPSEPRTEIRRGPRIDSLLVFYGTEVPPVMPDTPEDESEPTPYPGQPSFLQPPLAPASVRIPELYDAGIALGTAGRVPPRGLDIGPSSLSVPIIYTERGC